MVRPDDITNFGSNQWFSTLAGFGDWITNIIISILILGILYLVYLMLEHKIKVTYFPVYGVRNEDINKLSSMADVEKLPYPIEVGHPKKDRGREFRFKNVRKFSMLFSRKKIKEVPFNLRYSDGVWMLRPTKDTFIAIPRPTLQGAMNLRVPDSDLDLWQESAEADIRRRTQDEDVMKKQLYMTVAIIIGAFVLAGIIIWISMNFAGNSINTALTRVDGLTEALSKWGQAQGPG